MLKRLTLRDFAIIASLELEWLAGFSVLTGETGAGKSILIDALQLALGRRGDAGVVREGAARAEITAEFDIPAHLHGWLQEHGFNTGSTELLLRRTIDSHGKSRAWIHGSPATLSQLQEVARHLIDIHGQHAWQSLTRAASVRSLLDAYAKLDTRPLRAAWTAWRAAEESLDAARSRHTDIERERDRLTWQISEISKLGPLAGEWQALNAEHQRLANAQSLLEASRTALDFLAEAEVNADRLIHRAYTALLVVTRFDPRLENVATTLLEAQAQLQDATHALSAYLNHAELDPDRLSQLDERLSRWLSLARRFRHPPEDLPMLLSQWEGELESMNATLDLEALEHKVHLTQTHFLAEAQRVSWVRRNAAPGLSDAISQAMQELGMPGGRFEVRLEPTMPPQSHGLESAGFLVAGHAGSTPRPLAKVASGGELSRIALAIAVTTSQLGEAGTLIFDEVDAGVGGAVAEAVGRLMKKLGRHRQVLAVTHLPQVASCADHHFVVSKSAIQGPTQSQVNKVINDARVTEIARMLGGEQLSDLSLAHAREMLAGQPASKRKKASASQR